MPHKHKRRQKNESNYDLPPSLRATSLPVGKAQKNASDLNAGTLRGKRSKRNTDDTPKEFARLMRFQSGARLGSGLDNGDAKRGSKKRKRNEHSASSSTKNEGVRKQEQAQAPKIMPGERFADFAVRVDQALPVAGLSKKGKKVDGMKERRTKHDKRLQRMQADWRREEEKIREREEEEKEAAEEEEEEREALYGTQHIVPSNEDGKKGSKKRKRWIGEAKGGDDDPWAVLKERREEPKGLHDVAQAPPEFKRLPKEKFKVKNGARVEVANVPNAAGSLRQREELGETRKEIIERYRKMMGDRRGKPQ